MKKFLFGIALLFVAGNLMAQDVEDIFTIRYHNANQKNVLELAEGETTQIVISINSRTTNSYIGGQLDLVLPKGITVPVNANTGAYRMFKMGDIADRQITYYDPDEEDYVTTTIAPFNVTPNIPMDDDKQIIRDEEGNSIFRVLIYQMEQLNDGDFFRFPDKSQDILRIVLQAEEGYRSDVCPIRIKDAKLNVSSSDKHLIPTSSFISYAIGDSGFGTLSLNEPLDFTEAGVSAYAVSDLAEKFATLTEVKKVEAGTPIVIKGDAGIYVLPVLEGDAEAISTNLLKGTPTSETVTADVHTFALATKDAGTGFYRVKAGVEIPQYKAYLEEAATANEFFLFEDATGINTMEKAAAESDVYTITGVKVNNTAQKGIYIQNGKKVVVK